MSDLPKTSPDSLFPAPSAAFSSEKDAEDGLGFAKRLRRAFDDASNAEIARRITTTDSTIKSYMDGDRLPVGEMLLRITAATGINLHWLLTGRGPERVMPHKPQFSSEDEELIRKRARLTGRSFDEEVAVLAALAAKFVESAK